MIAQDEQNAEPDQVECHIIQGCGMSQIASAIFNRHVYTPGQSSRLAKRVFKGKEASHAPDRGGERHRGCERVTGTVSFSDCLAGNVSANVSTYNAANDRAG